MANPALSGATKAFHKPKPPPKPISISNGALSAATSSWASKSSTPIDTPQPHRKSSTPGLRSLPPSPPSRASLLRLNSTPPALTPSRANTSLYRRASTEITSTPTTTHTSDRTTSARDSPQPQPIPPISPISPVSQVSTASRTTSVPPVPKPKPKEIQSLPPRHLALNAQQLASSAALLASARSTPGSTTPTPVTANPSSSRRNSRYHDHSMQLLSPHITDDTLANAIVGASLAVSRNPSPFPPLNVVAKKQMSASRSNSPRKNGQQQHSGGGLRETLRPQITGDGGNGGSGSGNASESENGRGRVLVRKGMAATQLERRKSKVRSVVTEDEFKRYAGLWASNRGLLFTVAERESTSDKLDDEVHNFVVRELWRRSRLPEHELREIWNLVDMRGLPRLHKVSFIAGMWLIDQRLKGRKIPVKVPSTIWESLERFTGLNVRIRLH